MSKTQGKWSRTKINMKNPEQHPIHILQLAAWQIVEIIKKVAGDSGKELDQIVMPIWVNGDRMMKITIEVGSNTEAEYAIFKAQSEYVDVSPKDGKQ